MSHTDLSAGRDKSIEASHVRLWRDQRGKLLLRCGENAEPVDDVRVARCFPWSLDGRYISIRNKDDEELYLFRTLDQAEPKTRELIERELAMQEFVPRITAVENIDDRYEVMAWKVQTDRGPIELQIKSADDIQLLDDGRIVIRDYAGGKFEVRDIEALDSHSRQLIEDHLG